MTDLFQQRVRHHQRRMQRYLKYVFNDHFAFTMTFLLGGLGFYYSGLLKTLPSPYPIGKIIVVLFWFLTLYFGQFASLIQRADGIFLLPKETQMRKYLNQALIYSCYLPFGVFILTTAMAMPLVVIATGNVSFSSTIFFIFILWNLKGSHLLIQRLAFFQNVKGLRQQSKILWTVVSLAILSVSIFGSYVWASLLAIFQIVFFYQWLWVKMHAPLDWEAFIHAEQTRLRRVYQFIHLFTDVPEMQGTIKRRKSLDWVFRNITVTQENTYLYLFSRHFVRGTEYSGLYLRLTVIGSLLLFFVNDVWFALGIGSLFLYLIGFQLLPLAQQFRYVTTVQLYPIQEKQKEKALRQLLTVLLSLCALIFGIIGGISLASVRQGFIVTGTYFGVVGLFIFIYLPYRIKKLTE